MFNNSENVIKNNNYAFGIKNRQSFVCNLAAKNILFFLKTLAVLVLKNILIRRNDIFLLLS